MATPKCSQCVALAVPDGDMGHIVEPCGVCGGWSCEWHGRDYRTGYEHEACHEAPDLTRADDGEY